MKAERTTKMFINLNNVFILMSLVAFSSASHRAWRRVEALDGREAILSCDVGRVDEAETIYVVLWYLEGIKEPIYSFDNRPLALQKGVERHVLQLESLEGRVTFTTDPVPALHIRPVLRTDQNKYICRVDFRIANSHTTYLRLHVVVPPSPPLLHMSGKVIYDPVVGPLLEGGPLTLSCIVTGGEPPPRLAWHMNSKMIDDTSEKSSSSEVINYLVIKKLKREFHDSTLTCSASNNNITSPATASLSIIMNLRPLKTWLDGPSKYFRDKLEHTVRCITVGSRPNPNMTWIIESVENRNIPSIHLLGQVQNDINQTTSSLTFKAKLDYHGKRLVCKSFNPIFPAAEQTDSILINITYLPVVSLELGRGASSTVREGEDVYFNCRVKSNPPTYKIDWLHENEILNHSPGFGTVITGQSLALRSVSRTQAGKYICSASNVEGDTKSDPISLQVNYAPVCSIRPASPVLATGVGQPVNVTCDVIASPKIVEYSWVFNNSVTSERVPDDQVQRQADGSSLVRFVARSLQDYGTLQCWAENAIGKMEKPCLFNILPADRPDPPVNCTVSNKTYDSLVVSCKPGFDGGLKQDFIARVYEAVSKISQVNISSGEANFVVKGLTPGLDYFISVVAENRMGESSAVTLDAFTYKMAENRMREETVGSQSNDPPEEDSNEERLYETISKTTALAVLGGLILFLLMLLSAIVIARNILVRRSSSTEHVVSNNIVFLPPPDEMPNELCEGIRLDDVHGIINYIPPPPGLSV